MSVLLSSRALAELEKADLEAIRRDKAGRAPITGESSDAAAEELFSRDEDFGTVTNTGGAGETSGDDEENSNERRKAK